MTDAYRKRKATLKQRRAGAAASPRPKLVESAENQLEKPTDSTGSLHTSAQASSGVDNNAALASLPDATTGAVHDSGAQGQDKDAHSQDKSDVEEMETAVTQGHAEEAAQEAGVQPEPADNAGGGTDTFVKIVTSNQSATGRFDLPIAVAQQRYRTEVTAVTVHVHRPHGAPPVPVPCVVRRLLSGKDRALIYRLQGKHVTQVMRQLRVCPKDRLQFAIAASGTSITVRFASVPANWAQRPRARPFLHCDQDQGAADDTVLTQPAGAAAAAGSDAQGFAEQGARRSGRRPALVDRFVPSPPTASGTAPRTGINTAPLQNKRHAGGAGNHAVGAILPQDCAPELKDVDKTLAGQQGWYVAQLNQAYQRIDLLHTLLSEVRQQLGERDAELATAKQQVRQVEQQRDAAVAALQAHTREGAGEGAEEGASDGLQSPVASKRMAEDVSASGRAAKSQRLIPAGNQGTFAISHMTRSCQAAAETDHVGMRQVPSEMAALDTHKSTSKEQTFNHGAGGDAAEEAAASQPQPVTSGGPVATAQKRKSQPQANL